MDFSRLDIDGAVINELIVVPSKKFVVTLLQLVKKGAGNVQLESDLQFNNVRHFRINVEAEPWMQVLSHTVLHESELLREFRKNSDVLSDTDADLMHFEIVCGRGKIDIIARNLTVSITNEVPYVE